MSLGQVGNAEKWAKRRDGSQVSSHGLIEKHSIGIQGDSTVKLVSRCSWSRAFQVYLGWLLDIDRDRDGGSRERRV